MIRHRRYQLMIPLFLYGDLSEREREELMNHVAECSYCRGTFDSTKSLHTLLGQAAAAAADDSLLQEARFEGLAALRAPQHRQGPLSKLADMVDFRIPFRPGFALGFAALLAITFLAGRFSMPGENSMQDPFSGGEVQVTNIRVSGNQTGRQTVEATFDLVKQVRLKGALDNPDVQKVLAYALVNGENAGIRLRAASSAAAGPSPEREMKAALILALRSDGNDGVRKEALQALLRCAPDREIRDALLHTLSHDMNPGLRIAAINGLDSLRSRGYQPDEEQLQLYRQHARTDKNPYVRVKAQSLLEEKKP